MGQFWAVLVRMEDRRECSDSKIVSQCCEPARRVYYRVVVEVKKEIPGSSELHLRRSYQCKEHSFDTRSSLLPMKSD
jgi:hypothetical protein